MKVDLFYFNFSCLVLAFLVEIQILICLIHFSYSEYPPWISSILFQIFPVKLHTCLSILSILNFLFHFHLLLCLRIFPALEFLTDSYYFLILAFDSVNFSHEHSLLVFFFNFAQALKFSFFAFKLFVQLRLFLFLFQIIPLEFYFLNSPRFLSYH